MLFASSSGSSSDFILPNGTFFVELIIFLVVLGVIAKFILPSLRRVLDGRAAVITDAQESSQVARAKAARLEKERIAVLEAARLSARTILEEAGRSVEELMREARARGQVERERRLAEASGAIETERRRVHEAVLSEAVELVIVAAERIVGGGLEADRDRNTILSELTDAQESAPSE